MGRHVVPLAHVQYLSRRIKYLSPMREGRDRTPWTWSPWPKEGAQLQSEGVKMPRIKGLQPESGTPRSRCKEHRAKVMVGTIMGAWGEGEAGGSPNKPYRGYLGFLPAPHEYQIRDT